MRKTTFLFSLSMLALLYCACTRNNSNTPETVQGMVPVYVQDNSAIASLKQISGTGPRAIVNGGKMYTTGSLLFQVEQDSGIHVINYANPQQPQKVGFIRSFLCKEVTVKNGLIYTNNFSDLVVIDISNLSNAHEVSRTPNVFPDLALQHPPKLNPLATVYFECPDPAKGTVVRWETQTIYHPKCWR